MAVLQDVKRATSLARRVISGRRTLSELRSRIAERGPLPQQHFQIGVYFADSDVNIYQMRQWYAPLRELSKKFPVLVLARNPHGANLMMEESGLEVAYVPKVSHLEKIVTQQPLKIVFYVNQNTRNFQMLRYGKRFHVFINHGESDKMYMKSNQYTAYDFAFIAGEAARERLARTLWRFPVDDRTFEIGRPQADHLAGEPPYERDERTVVLYSPTWEGDRPTALYGSVASHGEQIVEQLLATGEHRVIYRPHPRSGVVDDEFGAANQRIIDMIGEANAVDPNANHVYDTSGELGWQLREPDIAICDVSAMIYDRLATGKPLLVTRPAAEEALIDDEGYLTECEWLTVADAEETVEAISRVLHNDEARQRIQRWSKFYFGDTSPGVPTQRFESAVATLMQEWESWAASDADGTTRERNLASPASRETKEGR